MSSQILSGEFSKVWPLNNFSVYKPVRTNLEKKKDSTATSVWYLHFYRTVKTAGSAQRRAVIEGPTDYFGLLLHVQPWITGQNASANLEL